MEGDDINAMFDDKIKIGALFGKKLDALAAAKKAVAEEQDRLQSARLGGKAREEDEIVARIQLCVSVVAAGGIVVEIEEWLEPSVNGLVSAYRFTKQRNQIGGLVVFGQQEFEAGNYHEPGWCAMAACRHVGGVQALTILRNEEFLRDDERLVLFFGRCYYYDDGHWQEIG